MPELPEVETVRATLSRALRGRRIAEVSVGERRLRVPVQPGFEEMLRGRAIERVRRRGKYLLIELGGKKVWIVHLGMSGRLVYVPEPRPREKHDHIVARLVGGGEIRYRDPRRFGLALVLPVEELRAWAPLRGLGVDPFEPAFTAGYLEERARASRRRIRDLLIDQSVIAGLGNIYANEALFRAGVRPAARAGGLARERIGRIVAAVRRVLREAIAGRGTSLSDYRDGDDRAGDFQRFLRVYGREGRACRRCGGRIKRVALGGRGAFYCPRCQR
jgi:formamidopyrimidine-DNA glycosylase